MSDILQMINEYRIILGAIVLLLLTTLLLKYYWEQVGFFWLRVRCAMPVFGKVARLSKQTNAWDQRDGWFHSEKALCAEFLPYFQNVDRDEEFFSQCQSYLSKAQEIGRNKLHLLGWVLIALMVFVEAMGFSYVLAGWTIPGASEALQQQGAVGIAFLISALLVYLTHKTGQEMHQNHLVKKVRTWFNGERDQLVPDTRITLEENALDNDAPAWRQLLNRLNANANVKPSHIITIITLAFIVAVAIGATYVRGQAMDEMLSRQQVSQSGQFDGSYQNPYSNAVLPDELADIQRAADEKAQDSALEHQRKGGWGTFIVLAFIFVFLQAMGIMIGYFTGFSGKESANARSYIGRFKNKKEFSAYYAQQRVQFSQIAQKHLSRLQQGMIGHAQQNNTDGDSIHRLSNPGNRNFLAYVNVSQQEHHDHATRERDRQHDSAIRNVLPPATTVEAPTRTMDESARHEATPASESLSSSETNEEDMKARIQRRLEAELAVKQEKQAAMLQREAELEAQMRKEMGLE